MLVFFNGPVIVSMLLLSWAECSMSLVVLSLVLGLLFFFSSKRIENIFSTLTAQGGNSELEFVALGLIR